MNFESTTTPLILFSYTVTVYPLLTAPIHFLIDRADIHLSMLPDIFILDIITEQMQEGNARFRYAPHRQQPWKLLEQEMDLLGARIDVSSDSFTYSSLHSTSIGLPRLLTMTITWPRGTIPLTLSLANLHPS